MSEKRKFWWLAIRGECGSCGRDQAFRIRKYTPKPKCSKERIRFLGVNEAYCGCGR